MWKDVKGFEDVYRISDSGEVWSKDRECTDSLGRKRVRKAQKITPGIASNGYYRVTLAKNGKKINKYLHRLLAEHFIENSNNLPQVNHKDGDKLNCSLDNLEWVSAKENTIHAYKHGLMHHVSGEKHFNYGKFGGESKRAKAVKGTNVITGEVRTYAAIIETKADGFCPSEVSRSIKCGSIHHGFVFELI